MTMDEEDAQSWQGLPTPADRRARAMRAVLHFNGDAQTFAKPSKARLDL